MKKLAKKYEYQIMDVRSKSQYYTPTVKELLTFIVNEKYCYTTGKSNKNVIFEIDFKKPNLVHNLREFIESNDFNQAKGYNINHKLYLLKYLDKIDIEELGYEVEEEKNDKGEVVRYNFCIFPSESPEQNVVASYWIKHHQLIIHNFDIIIPNDKANDLIHYFIGRIQNKSELKVLVNQLELK